MKPIRLTKHACEQASERGASKAEVKEAITKGSREPAKHGRKLCRYNFRFGKKWQGSALLDQTGRARHQRKTGQDCYDYGLHILLLGGTPL